jgi:hypothetical protein
MKKYFLFVAFAFISAISFGQNALSTGKTQLNLGVGFSDWGVPLYIGLDHAVSRDVTFGGELSYRSYRDDWNYVYYDNTIVGISGDFNYHFNNLFHIQKNWDLYAGLNAGFYIWNTPISYGGSHTSGLGLGAQVGARYYFTNNFGINLEFGGGNEFSGGKLGITLKL